MTALTLKQLLQLANLSPEIREKAKINLSKMTSDEKFMLSQVCWESILAHCENEINRKQEEMIEKLANQNHKYSPESFQSVEDQVITDLLGKIDDMKTEEHLQEVKSQLLQHADHELNKLSN